jgi:predicted RNA-binding Zn-ribbon protein involved in translation (DUF1610 family)
MSNDTPTPEPQKVGPSTKEELMEQGWPEEHAEFLAAFDSAVQGRDVSIVLPVVIFAVENLTSICEPQAMQNVAGLLSEAAMRVGQRAAERIRAELEDERLRDLRCPKCGNDDLERPEGEESDKRHCLECGHDFNLPPAIAAGTTEQPPEAPAAGTLH